MEHWASGNTSQQNLSSSQMPSHAMLLACSEWVAPSFITPKKDGTVRFINAFRELNKRIQRKPHPIPNAQDMLLNLEGFQCATSLDLNVGCYHIELSPTSRKLCTLVFLFGKCKMQRLPVGLCDSFDIFQEKMSMLFDRLEFVQIYTGAYQGRFRRPSRETRTGPVPIKEGRSQGQRQ